VYNWGNFPFLLEEHMNLFTKLYLVVRNIVESEEGQDLVEYALVVALIAFGAITGMGYLATGLNNAFSGIASTLTSNV
jgi:pilus assembly protein Flp/PilA